MAPKAVYRCVIWLNIFVQLLFPVAGAFTPLMVAAAEKKNVNTGTLLPRTRPRTLREGETVSDVALRYHLSVAALKTLNQFRTFSKPFCR